MKRFILTGVSFMILMTIHWWVFRLAFYLRTVVGNGAQLENKTGLTLEELLETADRYPEAKTFDGMTRQEIMQYLMMFNEDTFIDWDTGICHFDSETFKEVLRFVSRFPDSVESGREEKSLPTKIQNGEVLFAIAEMNTLQSFEEYAGMFGGGCRLCRISHR